MVEVKFFASLRERIALGSLASSASSLPELRRDLASQLSPEAYQVLCGDGVRVAINQVFTDDDWQHSTAAIPAGAEVAFLPPVTGGNLLESIIKIQSEDFDFAEYYSQIRASGGEAVGAIAGFVGLVRDYNAHAGDGGEVATLTLEHYPGMTESSIKLVTEARRRWPLEATTVVHRVGTLRPSDKLCWCSPLRLTEMLPLRRRSSSWTISRPVRFSGKKRSATKATGGLSRRTRIGKGPWTGRMTKSTAP